MSESSITESQVRECLKNVNDPEIGRNLVDLDMVEKIELGSGNAINLTVQLPTPAYPRRERIAQSIQAVVAARLPDVREVSVRFSARVKGKQTGGAIGLKVQNVIAVGSGK